MASYDAQINLLVSGQRELDRLTDRLRSIERQIVDINRLGVKPQQRDPVTGRFGADPDRENRIRLARIQRIGKEEERRARLASASLRTQNSELERSILLQSKLNSAVDLYERKLDELSRGGGGARLSEDLRAQIRDIRAAYQAATDGGTKNLSLVRSLATELGRVVERQNEINRLSSFQSKAFYDTQRFERRIAELRRAGADASAFSGVGGQMKALRSAQARGNESEAKDATRRIKEALDRIARNLDETIREARTQQSAQKAARSWETFFEEASTTALLLKQNQKNASAKFAQFFEDAANQALQISQNAKDTRKSWQFFFEDAQKEADRLRTERLSNFARLRGNPNQYSAEAGPLPTSRSGSPRYFAEAKEIADQLLIAEDEIAKIRKQSLNESLRLESERLSLVDKRKEKEKQIKNVLLEAVSFGKGSQVKDIVNQVKTGGRNALVRGGLGLGALGAGGLYEGITGLGDVNLGVLNAIKGPVGVAASAIGDSINSALGGVPAIINSVLSGLGDIPGVLGLAAVAAYAFAPAMKTAGEAVYLAGQKFGETKFGKNIKLTLDRQTNIFESGINAASQMTMPIDASGFDKNLEIRQSAKDTSDTWRVFFEDTAAFALQLKQNAKDTSKKWTEFFQDASYQALQIKENNKSTRKSWQVFFEDAASQALLIKQQARETAKSWQDFFEDAANQALQIKQNAKATAQSWRSFFENAASEALRVSQEAKNTSNNWRQFFEDAAYQALQIKQNGKDTSESWRVFFEDAAYEAFSIKEKAKSTRSSWQQFFEDAELEAKRLRGGKKTGLQSTLEELQEARSARQTFLGSTSPAEAIDKIVREFNTGKPEISNTAKNLVTTYASEITAGIPAVADAMKNLGIAGIKAIKKALRMASPSRVMLEIAKNQIDTYVGFLRAALPAVEAAAKAVGEAGTPKAAGIPKEAIRTPLTEKARTRPLTNEAIERNKITASFAASQITGPLGQLEQVQARIEDFINKTRTSVDLDKLFAGFPENARFNMAGMGKSAGPDFDKLRAALADFYQVPAELTPDLDRGVNAAKQASTSGDQLERYVLELVGGLENISSLFKAAAKLPTPSPTVKTSAAVTASIAIPDPWETVADTISNSAIDAAVAGGRQIEQGVNSITSSVKKNIIEDPWADVVSTGSGGAIPPNTPPGRRAGSAGDARNNQARQVKNLLGLDALADISRVSTRELEALSSFASKLRAILDPTIEGFDRLDNQLRETIGSIDRQLQRRDPNADFLTRRVGPRAGRAVSEGLIGGAFPLLFGQGAGASLGGLLGGAAGGFAGGGLGFGLSLIGTALGTALDQLGAAAAEAGKALRDPIAGFEKLKEANLFASKAQEFYIQKLIEAGRGAEANALIQKQIISKIGISGVNDLNRLGSASDALAKTWADLSLELQAAVAGPLAGLLEWVRDLVKASSGGIQKQAAQFDQQAFNEAQNKAQQAALRGRAFLGLSLTPGGGGRDEKIYQQELNRLSAEIVAKYTANQRLPEVRQQLETQEQLLKNAQQAADEIKQAYREGFRLQQQAIDLERQAADFRRRIADDIFNKQQEVFRAQVEADKLSADVRIKAVDLEYQKRIGQEEGRVAQLLEAEAELIRVKAAGQADIDSKKRLLELDIAKQERDTQNYIRNINTEVNNIRRQTLQYEMDVQDQREASERRIAELRRIDQMGAALNPTQTAPNGRPYYGPGGAPAGPMGTVQSRGGYTGSSIDGFPITSRPGMRWGRMHRGVDIGTPMGTALGYEVGGEVLSATTLDGYGKVLEVKLENGVTAFAAHLNEVLVKAGDRFTANQILARTGRTGRGTGPHLHMEGVRGGDPYSPLPYLQLGSMQAGSQVRQMQQAQSQIRPVNIPMVDTAAAGQQMTELNRQDEQLRRRSLDLSQQILNIDEQSALQKIINIATGTKELEQRRYQIDLLKSQMTLGIGIKNEQMDSAMIEAEYAANVKQRVEQNNRYLETTKLTVEEKKKVEIAMRAGLAILREQADLEQEILALTKMKAAEESIRTGIANFVEQNKQLDIEIEKRKLRTRLILEGNNAQSVEAEMRIFDLQKDLTKSLDQYNNSVNDSIKIASKKYNVNTDMIDSTFRLTEATLAGLVATVQDTEAKEKYRKKLQEILDLRQKFEKDTAGRTEAAIQETRAGAQKGPVVGEQLANAYESATKQLQELATWENVAVTGAQSIGDAFGQTFREIATGTATAQEILAGFFQNLANSFADMAASMINNLIQIALYKQMAGWFGASLGPVGGASSGLGAMAFGGGLASGAGWGGFAGALAMPKLMADGGMFSNGIRPFAMGGVVNSPTLFKFANGGAMSTGVMGEAGPEAILPLSRGSDGKLGVSASGSGGGDVNVTVNVDAKGSKVQGDDQSANQLGKAVAAAVQQELLKQKRPGGLL